MSDGPPIHYCTWCFAQIPAGTKVCPDCGTDLDAYARHTPYEDRVLHALHHPLSETRMAAILALGQMADARTADALADCALAHPNDVIQGIEILNSLHHMPAGPMVSAALKRLAEHPAHAVRERAQHLLDAAG